MKAMVSRIIVAVVLVSMIGSAVFAKGNKTTVTFADDVKVNETLVKRGTYKVVFNEESGELSILKHDKVVAKTAARLEMRDNRSKQTEIHTIREGDVMAFVGIAFGGSDQKVVVNRTGMQAGGND